MDRSSKWPRLRRDSLCPAVFAVLLAGALLRAAPVVAAGVVGTGTPESCTEAALDAALAGGGLVTFDCGTDPVTVTITSTKVMDADTTIDGGGQVTISGGNSVGVFSVNTGVHFAVQNLTIANGIATTFGGVLGGGGGITNLGTLTVTNSTFSANSASGVGVYGGGITNLGALTVTNSAFSGNSASDAGGGIFNGRTLTVTNSTFSGNSANIGAGIWNAGRPGTLMVTNSTFSDNSAVGEGGGIGNGFFGTVTVTDSTFSGNNASGGAGGGGIYNGRTLTVTNSTFSGNSAGGFGGGISNVSTLTVTNSTFSGNSAGGEGAVGGGIYNFDSLDGPDGTATVTNTTLANSSSGGNCGGNVTDGGHNIDDGTSCGFSTANGSLSGTNPRLDAAGLQNNGGPTETIALQAGSPAIDAGDQAVCAAAPVNNLDQRGYVRPGVGHTVCSIGAYEADAIPPPPCVGDCDGNGVVAINELILGVNIVLSVQPVDACSRFANAEGMVDIAQLIRGVNNALNGCSLG